MSKVYFDDASERERQSFPTGLAGFVGYEADAPFDRPGDTTLPINAATYQALFQLGVVDRLQHLPMQFGPIDNYEEAILFMASDVSPRTEGRANSTNASSR